MVQRLAAAIASLALTHGAIGALIEFVDRAEWEAAAGMFTTIDFTGFPDWTPITDQYADQGVTFANPGFAHSSAAFVNDGYGLSHTSGPPLTMVFAAPMTSLAFDLPGNVQVDFFAGDRLIGTSTSTFGPFVGFVSDVPFDSAVAVDPDDSTLAIDDLHWGPPIPTPGVLTALVTAGLIRRRRRPDDVTQ
jgi:hypothetical protein